MGVTLKSPLRPDRLWRRAARWFAPLVSSGVVWLAASGDAHAEPIRILIAAGSKVGLPAERPLKFADNDAKHVRDVMVTLGGVRAEHAVFLSDASRSELLRALDRVKAEAARHRPDEVTLLFYFSGHGDREALHFGADRVLVSELTTKLGEIPAGLRIAVTDACRATRDKGFTADEPFAISATMIPQASGQVWLHASSDGEAAQESDELQGAIFTHAWLSGLRGAADENGDARVTLEESFAFAHSQTLIRSARSSGVMQKPEAIVSLRESAPVVLTQTASGNGTLALPRGRDTHFLVYSARGKSVLSELWSSPDRALMLRVPPGRYVVQKRLGATGAVAQVAVGAGEQRTLEDKDFTLSSLEALAQKGETDQVTPPPRRVHHEVLAGYDVGASSRLGLVHGPRAAYTLSWPSFAVTLGGAADFGSRSLPEKNEALTNVYGRLAVELRLPLGRAFMLRGGVGGRVGVTAQTLTSTSGSTTETTNTAFMMGPETFGAARYLIGRGVGGLFVDLSATFAVPLLRQEDVLRGLPVMTGALALGARF